MSNVTIDPYTNCWEWNLSTNSSGYGQLNVNGKYWTSHRYVASLTKEDFSDKLYVRHICHNTRCCNPEHLLMGTSRENYLDSLEKHEKANRDKMKSITINNMSYPSIREAQRQTSLTFSSLAKYNNNGVFDLVRYREACYISRKIPKV